MKAVIMAGGKGTRLRPLTSSTPKPMVPLLDRPVMEYTIELLKKHGITDIAVTVQYLPEVIRQYFGDGSDFGVHLHYFEENCPLGTAGSVKNAEEFLDESFIVISGDALTDFDLSKAIDYHRRKQAVGTLVLTHVEAPLEFGVVMTDEDGEIVRFLEKPSWGEVFSDTVNTGIYILETEIFRYFDPGKEFDFSKDLFPLLMKNKRPLYGYVADGYWSDIGNLTQYRQTQFDMLDGKVEVSITGAEIMPGVWVARQAKVDRSAMLNGPCFIGADSVLEADTVIRPYSIVGAGSILAGGVSLERTVLWRNNFVDRGAEVHGATICQNVVLQSGAIVNEGAVIGDGCRIGLKSIIQPGLKVFPDKIVENHTTLTHSLIWGEKISMNLFGQFGVKGICNVDMTTHFANRLAMAFGTTLSVGATVGIGHDATPFAGLIAQSIASGLHASGIQTYDFGTVVSAVTRHATYHLDCKAGIHVRMVGAESDGQLVVEFLDESGLPLGKGMERKIENAYFQEDCRLIKPGKVGRTRSCEHAGIRYRKHLVSLAEGSTRQFTIVMEYDLRNLNAIIPELLESLNCRVIQLNRLTSTPAELARWVKSAEADFGIRLDANGQHTSFITEKGEVVSEELLSVLQIMIQLHANGEKHLNVPVNVPSIVNVMAGSLGRQVVRTKADARSAMEACQHDGFHIYEDGLYTLVHLMKLLTEKAMSFSELLLTIPSFTLLKEKVACPWRDKGKVMRFLMEATRGKQVELIDGIKIFHDDGWTLILPDSDEPFFQVFASADTPPAARELAATYTKIIEDCRERVSM